MYISLNKKYIKMLKFFRVFFPLYIWPIPFSYYIFIYSFFFFFFFFSPPFFIPGIHQTPLYIVKDTGGILKSNTVLYDVFSCEILGHKPTFRVTGLYLAPAWEGLITFIKRITRSKRKKIYNFFPHPLLRETRSAFGNTGGVLNLLK